MILTPAMKVGLFAFVAADAALFLNYTPLRSIAYSLRGRSDCPIAESVRALRARQKRVSSYERLTRTVRIVDRDPKGLVLWETPMGGFWMPRGSDAVIPVDMSEQEIDIYGTGEGGIRPGDVVFDCGANIGLFARKALDRGAALVVAIEPAPENLECLRRNLAAEIASGRVVVCPKGIWDKPDTLALHVDSSNSAADSFVRGRSSASDVQVPLVPLDQLVAELHLTRVDFIKMDIEGAERKALVGARGTLARFRPRLAISAYHVRGDVEAIDGLVNQARGDYRRICGACYERNGRLNAEILWFR